MLTGDAHETRIAKQIAVRVSCPTSVIEGSNNSDAQTDRDGNGMVDEFNLTPLPGINLSQFSEVGSSRTTGVDSNDFVPEGKAPYSLFYALELMCRVQYAKLHFLDVADEIRQ